MEGALGLNNVSEEDTGKGKKLNTGSLKRKYKMAEKKKSSKKCPVGQAYNAKTKKCVKINIPKDLQPSKGEGIKILKREFTKYPKKIIRKKIRRKRKEA